MNIKRIFALVLAVLLIISTFTACRKTSVEESFVSDVNSDTTINYSNVEIVENESEVESVVDTTSDVNSTTSDADASSTESTVSVEEPNTNINPDGVEIYGSGTADDPYLDTPNADTHTVKTLSIPAGKSVFYSIYRVGGKILTLNSNEAYVVCDGVKHTAQNGVVKFQVVDALASDAVVFEIGNTSSAAVNFEITFSDIEGSIANPTVVKTIDSEISLDLAEGNEKGYFYKYITEQAGTLKLYLLSGTDKSILLATNNRNSAQRSTESSEEGEVKSDDTGTYIELEVQKGDEIVINVGAKPNKRGKYPAITIKWLAKY